MAEPSFPSGPERPAPGPTTQRKSLFIVVASLALGACALSVLTIGRKRAGSQHPVSREESQVHGAGEQAARKSQAAIRDTTQQGLGEDLEFDAAGNLQGAHVHASDLPENKTLAQLGRRSAADGSDPGIPPGDLIGRNGVDEAALPRPGAEEPQDPESLRVRHERQREDLAELRQSFLTLPLDPRPAWKEGASGPPAGSGSVQDRDPALQAQLLAAQAQPSPALAAPSGGSGFRAPAPAFPATQQAQVSRPGEVADMRIGGGPEYVIPEGKFLDVALQNQVRIAGNDNPVVAQVTRDVLSEDGRWVLIPAGSIVTGVAGRVQTLEQERVFIPGHRIRFPNRRVAYFPERALPPATGLLGDMGARAKVNRHWMLRFGSAIMLGLVEGWAAYESGPVTTNPLGGTNLTAQQAGVQAASQNFNMVAERLLDLYSNIPATLTLPVGKRMKFYFSQDVRVNGYMPSADLHYVHRPRG
jgi:type IV secretion system protein VirB10